MGPARLPPLSAKAPEGAGFASPDAEIAFLRGAVAKLAGEVEALKGENAELRERCRELERSAGLNSSNSGKPPSSDGLSKPAAEKKKKKRTGSLRGKSGRRPGGQPGREGRTLEQSETPDSVVDLRPETCPSCGEALPGGESAGFEARQVFDIPPPQPMEVCEMRAHSCRCPGCGEVATAPFPDGVSAPVQYGPRAAALAAWLSAAQFLPFRRVAEIIEKLYGAKLSPATAAGMARSAADRLSPFADHVGDMARGEARVKHLDETGFRACGETQWLHAVCTELLSFFRIGRRGEVPMDLSGCAVHDHWGPYFGIEGVDHALCNAHHLRELEAAAKIDGEAWAGRMQRLLRRARRLAEREAGADLVERLYDRIVAAALEFHDALPPPPRKGRRGRSPRRKGHNLALRLRDRKADVLRFLREPDVPFTNNEAERDLRMMKLKVKVSGGFRSQAGAEQFAALRSVLATAKKQGWDQLQVLAESPESLAARLKVA